MSAINPTYVILSHIEKLRVFPFHFDFYLSLLFFCSVRCRSLVVWRIEIHCHDWNANHRHWSIAFDGNICFLIVVQIILPVIINFPKHSQLADKCTKTPSIYCMYGILLSIFSCVLFFLSLSLVRIVCYCSTYLCADWYLLMLLVTFWNGIFTRAKIVDINLFLLLWIQCAAKIFTIRSIRTFAIKVQSGKSGELSSNLGTHSQVRVQKAFMWCIIAELGCLYVDKNVVGPRMS